MKRVLVVSDLWLPFPGGAERLMFNLSRDLMRRGHDVGVITGYEYPQRFDGPVVAERPISLDEHGWPYIAGAIDFMRPDVILTHHLYARTFGFQLVATGIPVVQVVLNGAAEVGMALRLFISEWVREQAGGGLLSDMTMTPPVFDDVIAPRTDDATRLGFIKPIPHKGVGLVYDLARRMPERRFLILRGEWRDLEDIRPRGNIEFMDPVDDMRDFYRWCRLLLVPSLSEDAGTVAQEATVNGRPCISSNVGGLPETNAGGVQLDPADLDGWLEWIGRLDDPGVCADIVRSQREGLDRQDHPRLLAELAARIEAL